MICMDHPLGIRETWRENKSFIHAILLISTVLFFVISLAWPVTVGDWTHQYLDEYYDLGNYTFGRGFRALGAATILGHLLELNYYLLCFSTLCFYLIYILSSYYVSRLFGVVFSCLATSVITLHASVAILFHTVDSDMLACLSTVLWSVLAVRLHKNESLVVQIIMGCATFSLALIRPAALLFVFYGMQPVLCSSWSWKSVRRSIIFFIAYIFAMFSFSAYNYVNYGFFSIIKGGGGIGSIGDIFPSRSLFYTNLMYNKSNGPNSAELFRLVQEKLKSDKNYADPVNGEAMHVDKFFLLKESPARKEGKWRHLLAWAKDFPPGIIFRSAMEAVSKHPIDYIVGSILKPIYHFSVMENLDKLPLQRGQRFLYAEHYSDIRHQVGFENMKIIGEKTGNYYVAFMLKYSIMTFVPPMIFFIIPALFAFFIKSIEYRLITALVIPNFMLFALHSQLTIEPRLRLPYDFIFIIAGMAAILKNRLVVVKQNAAN